MVHEAQVLGLLKRELEKEYNELYDAMYHYIWSWLLNESLHENKTSIDVVVYKDEIENLIGIREHEEIIKYVFNNIKGEC